MNERTERLVGLIRLQESLYEQLDELSRAQRASIEGGRTDELLGILGQRQGLIDQIVDASEGLDGFREDWDRLVSEMPEATRRDVGRRMDRLSDLMRAIADRDGQDREVLNQRRAELGQGAKSVRVGGAAVAAYGKASGASPRFQDRKV